MSEAKEILYGLCGDETVELDMETIIERVIDDSYEGECPQEIEILEFERMKVSPTYLAGDFLEYAADTLWEHESAGEDRPEFEEDEDLQTAEAVFIAAILKRFVPWGCEPNGKTHHVDMVKEAKRLYPQEWKNIQFSQPDGQTIKRG